MKKRLLSLIVVVAAIVPACDKTPSAPASAGTAMVSLTTPNDDDGALLVTLRGPGISSVEPASSDYVVYWRLAAEDEVRIMVLGDLAPGPVFRVQLARANRLEAYAATIQQVASQQDVLRTGMGSYSLTLSKQ